ncbi:DnaJ family domain-containing protein [Paenibacillus sp. MBLB4367]|uniref:DnaJ family domain-containing protein n=1 Tax=Paenibacillus sp. MBLB4367 TaxID=3384767 RepID=UPI0039083760
MDIFESITERRIAEAIAKGEFDDLPGKGKPLALEDLTHIPEDLRMSYKVLKNAGVLPEEMQLRKDMLQLEDLIRCCLNDGERTELERKWTAKKLRFSMLMDERQMNLSSAFDTYRDRVNGKFS